MGCIGESIGVNENIFLVEFESFIYSNEEDLIIKLSILGMNIIPAKTFDKVVVCQLCNESSFKVYFINFSSIF